MKRIIRRTVSPYNDPRWKRVRDEIVIRDKHRCRMCGVIERPGIKMDVHHLLYDKDKEVWEVPYLYLATLCRKCHCKEHSKRLKGPSKKF